MTDTRPTLDDIRTAQYVYALDSFDFRRLSAVARTGHDVPALHYDGLTDAARAVYDALRARGKR
jgi:hypothetical protein